jgi:glycosyltransferase involved in cell wall biosynthesis
VVYDITDDWTSFKQSPRLMELVQRQDAELCERADAVIVCSERLCEMKRGVVPADRLHLIPNGVHTEHYRSVMDRGAVLPVMAREWKKPVMGYTGTVHGERVDVSLVRRLAAARGVGSVVLVGPNHLTPSEREALRLPNVFMPGAVAYRNIPDVMRAFDVCIVPHRMTAFTESLNPIKLWEYLAGGKPIVSTDVAGFRDYPKVVSVARTPEEFIAAALAAVGEGGSGQSEARRAEAEKHGWSKRVDLIEQVLEKCVGSRREGVYVG